MGGAVPPVPRPFGSSKKRRSRYSKIEVTPGSSSTLPDNFLSAAPRAAPRPPSSSVNARRQLTSLSAFDIIIDNPSSEPASLVSETSGASSTPHRPHGTPLWSPPRSCSPTPSLTSTSACSSAEMPRTPDGSDDEWPSPRNPRETLARPRLARHQLMLTKSTPSPSAADTSPEDSFEFTLEPFSFHPQSEDEEEEEDQAEEEQNMLWYHRELGHVVSLFPRPPSYGTARPDSLPPPPPRGSSSGTNQPSAHSRISKPVRALPHAVGPSRQLDPTFPRPESRLPRLSLCESTHPVAPASALAPPSELSTPPAVLSETRECSTSPASISPRTPVRKSLTITVPRAAPNTQLPLDVSDILDEIDAWSFDTPTTSSVMHSPARVPHSSSSTSSSFSEGRDPVELVVSSASTLLTPSPTSTTPTTIYTTEGLALPEKEDGEQSTEAEVEVGPACAVNCSDYDYYDEDRFYSRRSSSTLSLPVSSAAHAPIAIPALLRSQLGSVVRRMRVRRPGSDGSKDAAAAVVAAARLSRSSSGFPTTSSAISASISVPVSSVPTLDWQQQCKPVPF